MTHGPEALYAAPPSLSLHVFFMIPQLNCQSNPLKIKKSGPRARNFLRNCRLVKKERGEGGRGDKKGELVCWTMGRRRGKEGEGGDALLGQFVTPAMPKEEEKKKKMLLLPELTTTHKNTTTTRRRRMETLATTVKSGEKRVGSTLYVIHTHTHTQEEISRVGEKKKASGKSLFLLMPI